MLTSLQSSGYGPLMATDPFKEKGLSSALCTLSQPRGISGPSDRTRAPVLVILGELSFPISNPLTALKLDVRFLV